MIQTVHSDDFGGVEIEMVRYAILPLMGGGMRCL